MSFEFVLSIVLFDDRKLKKIRNISNSNTNVCISWCIFFKRDQLQTTGACRVIISLRPYVYQTGRDVAMGIHGTYLLYVSSIDGWFLKTRIVSNLSEVNIESQEEGLYLLDQRECTSFLVRLNTCHLDLLCSWTLLILLECIHTLYWLNDIKINWNISINLCFRCFNKA